MAVIEPDVAKLMEKARKWATQASTDRYPAYVLAGIIEELLDALDLLSAGPQGGDGTTQSQPVTWLIEASDKQGRFYADPTPKLRQEWRAQGWTVEPLYAHPASATPSAPQEASKSDDRVEQVMREARRWYLYGERGACKIMREGKDRHFESKVYVDERLAASDMLDAFAHSLASLFAEVEAKNGLERHRASNLLEAAWEAVSELGVTGATAERFLIPAILANDGDPEYARTTIEEMQAGIQALSGDPTS